MEAFVVNASDETEIDYVIFDFFLLENSSSMTSSSKIKILMKLRSHDSSFEREAIRAITTGPYMNNVQDAGLAVGCRNKDTDLTFEIIEQ